MSWDFALILFVLLVITGAVWCLDYFYLRKRRRVAGKAAVAACEHSLVGVEQQQADKTRKQAYAQASQPSWVIEYCVSFFPVILFVFVLRSFVIEPFRIPSGSMLPTLQDGDLILVNKFQYGIRLPIVDKKIISVGTPHRGDVMVFRYPLDPSVDYIKRVVGLPGDKILYQNKKLYINGKEITHVRDGDFFEPDRAAYVGRYTEQLGNVKHSILLDKYAPQDFRPIANYPFRQNCQYITNGVRCTVPAHHYFMMGDNRDNSLDSRYWGFVPDANIVGRAFFIWMNFGHPSRIGVFH